MTKGWIISIAIAAVIGVGAIVGVIYGVLSHTEAGWMGDGPPWTLEDMPLGLCVSTYAADHVDPGDLANAVYVVGAINSRLGFDALEIQPSGACEIEIAYGVPAEPGWQDPGGSAAIGGGRAFVSISNVHGELRTLVVQHELGHALGLAHDDDQTSIMRRVQSPTPDGQFPPRISDDDRRMLRRAYQ